jgi:uncharacterized paraquat-inducible protein A
MCDLSAEDSINQTGRNSQPSFRALPKEALLYMSGFRQTVSTVLIQTVPLPKITCERCGGHIEYPSEMAGQSIQCSHCQHTIKLLSPPPPPQPPPTIPQSSPVKASIKSASSVAGIGCALQGLGVVCLVLAVATFKTGIGPVIFGILGLWLLFYGGRKASWLECSACGGKLSHQRVSICPHCNSSFH